MNKLRKNRKDNEEKFSDKAILTESAPFGAKEAYKIARTNVMFALAGEKGCKKIAVTSALPSEGKTTASVNLAITFAQTDAKVLVIDADLRRPRVHQYLGEKNTEGLADLLAGFVELGDVIHFSDVANVDYISSGHIPPNPSELLESAKMEEILNELAQVYDYIIIDTPPVSAVADALIVAKLVSGMLIVVRQKQTPHDWLKKTISSLQFAEVKILGFLLNESAAAKKTYRGKYGKKYSYGYGYGYYEENSAKQ